MKIDKTASYLVVVCSQFGWNTAGASPAFKYNYSYTSPYLKKTAFDSELLQELNIEKLRFNPYR